MTATNTTDADDDLGELPPLDGDAHDAPDGLPEPGASLDDEPEANADLDDSTGEGDPADADELDLERGESEARDGGWLVEPADAPDLDLGGVAIVDFGEGDSFGEDATETLAEEEDFGFGVEPERGGLDGGDEGPLDGDEELREADLPALDADDDADVDDASLAEAGFAVDEPLGLPWASDPWSRVGAPVELAAVMAVACAGHGALVVGRSEGGLAEMLRLDLEGTSQTLPMMGLEAAMVRALAVEGEAVAALLDGGGLMLSVDGGASFAPVAEEVAAAEIALESGALWVRTRNGELMVIRGNGARVDAVALPSPVAAMARDGLAAVASMIVDHSGRVVALLRTHGFCDGSVAIEALDAPPAREPATLLAVRGAQVAYAGRRGGVVRRNPDGTWGTHLWKGRVTALAFVDDAGTLVAATYSDADDTTALVRLEPHVGLGPARSAVVARIGPTRAEGHYDYGQAPYALETVDGNGRRRLDLDTDGRVLAMAHDDARGVLWAAGGFGVAAFAVR